MIPAPVSLHLTEMVVLNCMKNPLSAGFYQQMFLEK